MPYHTIFLDSFSGDISDLPKCKRNIVDALTVLSKNGKVSTFDMDTIWVRSLIKELEEKKFIIIKESWYPWYVYKLTKKGIKHMEASWNTANIADK